MQWMTAVSRIIEGQRKRNDSFEQKTGKAARVERCKKLIGLEKTTCWPWECKYLTLKRQSIGLGQWAWENIQTCIYLDFTPMILILKFLASMTRTMSFCCSKALMLYVYMYLFTPFPGNISKYQYLWGFPSFWPLMPLP